MAHLVAAGPETGQRWCRELPSGKVVRLGRSPGSGWDVAWDRQISREHAELVFDNDLLTVQKLETAQNPIHFDGEPTSACVLDYEDTFRIGQTVFQLVEQPPESSTGPADPQHIGEYVISSLLGTGGMGSVYMARHVDTGQVVALKVLGSEQSNNPELLRRFQLEGEVARELKHLNLVEVLGTGSTGDIHYIVQEFVDGIDVGQLISQRGSLPVKRSISIIRQLAESLAYLHENNIIHRDIKPSNLLISRDGTAKLADMGVARLLEEESDSGQRTVVGTVVGTVDYIAPEQANDSHTADARSDIYSLGCTWYEMLTGSPPFPDGNLTAKITAHATQSPPDPRELNPDIPAGLVAVIMRMMAKLPRQRHQTIQELLDDIATDTLVQPEVSSSVLAALAESAGEFRLETPQPTTEAATAKPLVVRCSNCGQSYKVRAELAGKRLKCRECGKPIKAQAQ
jgi:serine/threonine protein kinase